MNAGSAERTTEESRAMRDIPTAELTALVVDDHPLFCDALMLTLSSIADFSEIQTAGTMDAALGKVAANANFNLILLDLNLPGITGLQLLQQLRNRASTPLVIALTSYNDATLVRRVQDAGGNAYPM